MSATEYCSNEHNPTAWNVKRRAKENCLLSWPLAPKRHNSLETGSYCSGGGEKASKTGPFDRCRNQANVLGTVLEQFHLKLLYRRTKCGAQRRPTRRAARRAGPVAQRAYRHREQRGVDSCENQVFHQNINFKILQISKLICSRSGPEGFPAWPVQGKVMKGGMDEGSGGMVREFAELGGRRRGSIGRTREAPHALRAARGASEQFLAAAYFPT